MAKIRFENGTVVNFEGTPTAADVEEVALKLGISKKAEEAPAQPKPFLDRITKSPIAKGIQSFFPGAKLGEAIGTSVAGIGQALRGNLKGAADIAKSQTPVKQVAGDVANILLTAGGAALPVAKGATALSTIGKTAAQAGVLGAGQSGSKAISQGATLEEAGEKAVTGGLTSAAIAGGTTAFGELLRKSGEKILTSTIKPTQADIRDGFSIDTVRKHNLGGSLDTMLIKTEGKMNKLSTELSKKLEKSTAAIDVDDVYNQTAKKLTGGQMKTFGANTSMDKALEQLRAEIAVVGGGKKTIPEAQLLKQASGKMGAWQFGQTDPDATARQRVYNAFYSTLRESIEKNSPAGVKEINKQLSELIPVNNAILRRIPVADRNNLLSLQDMVTLTASAMNPSALGGFALSLAQKSGAFGNAIAKLGTQIPKVAPVAGQIGANLATQSPQGQSEISQLPISSPNPTTFSPEVQRILNMQQ